MLVSYLWLKMLGEVESASYAQTQRFVPLST